jgi:hypothetical protein
MKRFQTVMDRSKFQQRRDSVCGTFLYYPVWTLQELIDSSYLLGKHQNPRLSEKEISDRFYKLGGIPSSVFANNHTAYLKMQSIALEELTEAQGVYLARKRRSAITTSASNFQKNELLAYTLAVHDDDGTYRDSHAELISDYVCESIAKKYMFLYWTSMNTHEESFDVRLFESYCATLFHDAKNHKLMTFTVRDHIVTSGTTSTVSEITLSSCQSMERVKDQIAAAVENPFILFCPISSRGKPCDFIYQENNTYYIFKCTIAKSHSTQSDHMYNWVSGVLNTTFPTLSRTKFKNDDSNTDNSENHTGETAITPKFHFFYMVPDFNFDVFAMSQTDLEMKTDCVETPGAEATFYLDWKDMVKIQILKVEQPSK